MKPVVTLGETMGLSRPHSVGFTTALSDSAHEAVLRAISIAHRARVPVSFDVNHRTSLWRQHPLSIY